jgi:hypothetical protein
MQFPKWTIWLFLVILAGFLAGLLMWLVVAAGTPETRPTLREAALKVRPPDERK